MANRPMGIGELGFSNVIFKRKFRWTFELEPSCNGKVTPIAEHFVKIAARPSLSIEETELNFLNAKSWIPGKASWETITVTYYDVAVQNNTVQNLWNWLISVYNFQDPIKLQQGSRRSDYEAKGIIKMYDGCGTLLEQWQLDHVFPTAVNFGDLDDGSSEECTIELTLRYSDVKYIPEGPNFELTPCCTPCR